MSAGCTEKLTQVTYYSTSKLHRPVQLLDVPYHDVTAVVVVVVVIYLALVLHRGYTHIYSTCFFFFFLLLLKLLVWIRTFYSKKTTG